MTDRKKEEYERLLSVRCFSSIINSITAMMIATPAITGKPMITAMYVIDSALLFVSIQNRTEIHLL